jgi:hypothetical protein
LKKAITFILATACKFIFSQSDTVAPGITITGYIETYFSYDLSNPGDHLREPFFYCFNRHNEVNLNLGYIQLSYEKDGVRGNFALMAGTYAEANLAAEGNVMQHVLEANAGIKLSKKSNLWLDAGIMPSHIGFESATGKVCWNLTRSILAENSPYYESGAKLGFTSANNKFYASALFLNGWQRMKRVPGCNTPAGGTQITLTPNDRFTFNWSTYIGNEFPDTIQKWRYFNNFYSEISLHKKLAVILGFDYGMQQSSKGSTTYDTWYSPILITKFSPGKKMDIGARAEYYVDSKGVIIYTGTANGFDTYGYSLNVDYHIKRHITWRVEGRTLLSKDPVFAEKGHFTNQNYFFTTSLAVVF